MCNLTDEQTKTLEWIADEQNKAAAEQAERDGTLAPPLKTATTLHRELVDNMLATFERDRLEAAKRKMAARLENLSPEQAAVLLANLG